MLLEAENTNVYVVQKLAELTYAAMKDAHSKSVQVIIWPLTWNHCPEAFKRILLLNTISCWQTSISLIRIVQGMKTRMGELASRLGIPAGSKPLGM